ETDVLLRTGQGMIIGGLIQERDSTTVSKVPLLGSLPYAGFFFQRKQQVKRRSEIIVALMPHVLPYCPELQSRNDHEMQRVRDPLTYGPLCRYPRPYEPQLADVLREQPPWVCRHDQPNCPPPSPSPRRSWCTPRRLPPVGPPSDPECGVARRPSAAAAGRRHW
ncbi:MAG: hypothetical protein AAF790_11660, partial [Planctomycetota bacterium]